MPISSVVTTFCIRQNWIFWQISGEIALWAAAIGPTSLKLYFIMFLIIDQIDKANIKNQSTFINNIYEAQL